MSPTIYTSGHLILNDWAGRLPEWVNDKQKDIEKVVDRYLKSQIGNKVRNSVFTRGVPTW